MSFCIYIKKLTILHHILKQYYCILTGRKNMTWLTKIQKICFLNKAQQIVFTQWQCTNGKWKVYKYFFSLWLLLHHPSFPINNEWKISRIMTQDKNHVFIGIDWRAQKRSCANWACSKENCRTEFALCLCFSRKHTCHVNDLLMLHTFWMIVFCVLVTVTQ